MFFLWEYVYLVFVCESQRAAEIVLAALWSKTVCLSIVGLLMWFKSASNAKLYPTGHGFSHGLHHKLHCHNYYTICSNCMYHWRERRQRERERRVCERVCSWSTISVCDRTTCVHACMWHVCVASNVSDTWLITFLNQSLSHASIKQYTVPIFSTVTLPLWVITYVCVLECLTASLPKLKVWEALGRVHLCETGHQRHRPRRCTFGFLPPRFCLYGFLFIHCLDSHTHTHTHTHCDIQTDRHACC